MIIRSSTLNLADDVISLPLIGWDNLVTADNTGASHEDESFPAINLANVATNLVWKSTDNTVENSLNLDFDGLTDISYVGIAGHNFGTIGNSIHILGFTNNSPDSAEIIELTFIEDDCPLIFQFEAVAYTRLEIKIEVPDIITDTYPQAAVVYAGPLLTCQRSISLARHIPINLGKKTEVVNGMSESGQFLGRIVRTQYTQSKAQFEWFEPAWYRANFDPFVKASKETPFFWAWNPDEQPDDTGYAWLIEDAIPEVDPVTRRMSVDLNMRALTCP